MKKPDKISEKSLIKVKIRNLPKKACKVMTIKMFNGLQRRMDEQSEKLEVFNELENIKMNQTDEEHNN